jgi:hypothetical protein
VEIEILKGEGKETNESKKLECVHGIKELKSNLGEFLEEGYKLLANEDLSDKEKNQLIDIMASAKGAGKILGEMLAEKSDIPEETRKKIEKKADNFLAGLEGKEDKTKED